MAGIIKGTFRTAAAAGCTASGSRGKRLTPEGREAAKLANEGLKPRQTRAVEAMLARSALSQEDNTQSSVKAVAAALVIATRVLSIDRAAEIQVTQPVQDVAPVNGEL